MDNLPHITKPYCLRKYMIKMRLEDFLKDHYVNINKITRWKCPICYNEYNTKTHALFCLVDCRNRVMREHGKDFDAPEI